MSSQLDPGATSALSDDRKGLTVTADLGLNRINIGTEGDIVVGSLSG